PNTERHAVWDGWAVRRETAPAEITVLPGREMLLQRSHDIFSLRQWLYKTGGPDRDDRGFASEGTWKDLISLAGDVSADKTFAARETERLRGARRGGAK